MTALSLLASMLAISPMGWTRPVQNLGSEICDIGKSTYQDAVVFFHQEQFLLASVHFKLSRSLLCESEAQESAQFFYALSMFQLGESQQGLLALQTLDSSPDELSQRRLQLARYFYANQLAAPSRQTNDLQARIQNWESISLEPEIKKSPVMAGLLSGAIPGAGLAYVGSWSSAFYSLAINSLFFAAGAELQNRGLYASSLVAWTVFSVTYVGGILNSVESARIFNANQVVPKEKNLKKQLFPELTP